MNLRLYLYAGLALALIASGFSSAWYIQGKRWSEEVAQIQSEHDKAYAQAQVQARSEESRRQSAIEGIRRDAQERIAQLKADAATAGVTADSLREQVNKLAGRPAKCPDTADRGQADPDKLLLAKLFSEADAVAGRMAAEADRSRVAGEACVAAYDSLSIAQEKARD